MNTILKKIENKFNKKNILFKNKSDIYYLTRFKSSNLIVLLVNKKWYALTDNRYLESAKKEINFMNVLDINKKNVIKKIMDENDQLEIFISKKDISIYEFENLKKWSIKNKLKINLFDYGYIRDFYEKEDIELIKKSLKINEEIFNKILKKISINWTEKEIKKLILNEINNSSADCPSFDPIVASGASGSNPHWESSNKKINKNELITIDMGVMYKGFASDMTRTFIIEGNVSDNEKKIWNVTNECLKEVIKNIKSGVKCKKLHEISLKVMDKYGYKKYFTHSLGHGLGIEIHDKPNLSIYSDEVLKEGMIITIEPGIYIPNKYGVRLEETVLVKKNSCEILNETKIKLKY